MVLFFWNKHGKISMKILALNSSYISIKFVSVYSAIGRLYCGNAKVIRVNGSAYEEYDFNEWEKVTGLDSSYEYMNTCTGRFPIPHIIRYLYYSRIPKATLRLSRKSIYERDNYTCYICGKKFGEKHLSLDHMIPVSKGGRTEWENLATCCIDCNSDKADNLLSELKIKPRFLPFRPSISNTAVLKSNLKEVLPEWKLFGI
jgi:5-methylcytosine-specific restriction endonuclease McrA